MPTQPAPAASAGMMPTLLAPVDALLARRTGQAVDEPLIELQQLGYLSDSGEPPAWEQLDGPSWLALLRAIARRCPRLATALAAARLTSDIAGRGVPVAELAMRASCLHATLDGTGSPPLRMAAALLATLSEPARPVALRLADGVSVPAAALRRVPHDLLAVACGALWRLWNACAAHVESRPMFRRVLADFPVIRYRMLCALIAVLEAEEQAGRAPLDPGDGQPLAAFRAACLQVRIETQQLCGGSGFMRESDYAAALLALDDCMRVLGWMPCAVPARRDLAHPGVRMRLKAWGVSDAEWEALARFGTRPRCTG